MALPTIINIAIGSIFIFLILSLLAAEIQELIATLLQWRAVHLKRSIEILLTGGESTPNDKDNDKNIKKVEEIVNELYDNPLIKNINQEAKKGVEAQFRKLTTRFADLGYEEKQNTNGKPERKKRTSAPSYIPAETFATTLLVKLGIPDLVHQLSWYNLRKIINNELVLEIKQIVKNSEESVRSKLNDKVKLSLEPRLERIIDNFRSKKTTLNNCLAQVINGINVYIEDSKKCFVDDTQKAEFSNSIESLKEDILGMDEKYEELIHRIQPNLTQVIELLNEDSKIFVAFFDEIKEVIKDESSPSHQAYTDLKTELETLINGLPVNVRKSLAALAVRTQIKTSNVEQELNQFKKEVEVWFDRSMDRASGVYKRNAKGVAFLIGFIVAAIANADTLHIVSRLSNDDALQKAIVDSASQIVIQKKDLTALKTDINKALTDISLPIGWSSANLCQQGGYQLLDKPESPSDKSKPPSGFEHLNVENICGVPEDSKPVTEPPKIVKLTPTQRIPIQVAFILYRLPGWLLSALAITMGAPFWFELLNKFINVRNTGKKPASPVNTQAGSRDPAAPPQI